MAIDDVVNRNTDVLEKDVAFNEEEAYLELCQIISMAQQTGNYTKFQSDLNQWKKHYPIESFSEKYKNKIKYMLSEQFLNSILKDYLTFEKHLKMDPSKQLDKLRRIFDKAKIHKDEKRLNSDLEALYKEYPLNLLKEKFPHIVSKLMSSSYREEILQKFNYKSAFEEFTKIFDNAKDFSSEDEFQISIEELKKKYPLEDFSDEYRKQLEPMLKKDYLHKLAEDYINLDSEDLTSGTVIPLNTGVSLTENNGIFNQKDSYFELLEILKNPSNVDGVFNWSYKYMKYIGRFDDYHKGLIISSLAPYYKFKKQANYRIPDMNSKANDYLSFEEYQSINETKKDTVLQFVALLSTDGEISQENINRLEIIHANATKAQAIQNIANELDLFAEKSDKDGTELTPIDTTYFSTQKQEKTNKFNQNTNNISNKQELHNNFDRIIDDMEDEQETNNNSNRIIDYNTEKEDNSSDKLTHQTSEQNYNFNQDINNTSENTNTLGKNKPITPDHTQTPKSDIEQTIDQKFSTIKFDDEPDFIL